MYPSAKSASANSAELDPLGEHFHVGPHWIAKLVKLYHLPAGTGFPNHPQYVKSNFWQDKMINDVRVLQFAKRTIIISSSVNMSEAHTIQPVGSQQFRCWSIYRFMAGPFTQLSCVIKHGWEIRKQNGHEK